ncbi:hypothetical protein ACX1N5_03285 [Acinetobacter sp. ANC 4636]
MVWKTAHASWLVYAGLGKTNRTACLPNQCAHSVLGMLLHGVVGYQATPTQMQVVFYLSSIAII